MEFGLNERVATGRPGVWAYFFNMIREKAGSHCRVEFSRTGFRAAQTYHYSGEDLTKIEEHYDRYLYFRAVPN